MADLIKGNFPTKNRVQDKNDKSVSLEERFEREALKKLGGSMAFVSKQKVMWDTDETAD